MSDKQYAAKCKKEYVQDKKTAEGIRKLGIVEYPMCLPSLHRVVARGISAPMFTTGYDWEDKPHRVAFAAIEEIRALRKYILNNMKAGKT
jgi:hypothetical protein